MSRILNHLLRTWLTWTIFAGALVIALAAMGWISLTVLDLDAAQAKAQRQAALEESVRLALWRMDSTLAPLLAQENARPYFTYTAFYPAEGAYTRMFNALDYGDVLIPSPLMTFTSPQIIVHFQYGPDGKLSSPQAPENAMRELAEKNYLTSDHIAGAAAKLEKLRALLSPTALAAALPTAEEQAASNTVVLKEPTKMIQPMADLPNAQAGEQQQSIMNQSENSYRENSSSKAYSVKGGQRVMPQKAIPRASPHVAEGVMRPLTFGDTLVLARRVRVNGGAYLQGCQLNWPAIQEQLVGDIHDLLPGARLEFISDPNTDPSRVLAMLPVRLIPGAPAIEPSVGVSPLRVSLATAWLCVAVAAVAVAVLLRGALALSERRASFVSAVTHEMRTPLTTFRLYTEMLGEGRVRDEATRHEYLRTLRDEAERLTHMVENVLAHARLERGKTRSPVEPVTLGAVLERVTDRLRRRTAGANKELVVEVRDGVQDTRVYADVISLEQILLNLVDNACKYAADAKDQRVHLEADVFGGIAMLRVRDHGPGIDAEQAKRLFRPFSKSAREAADSAPGVGLGLALSRRLARAMGGDLSLDLLNTEGAAFVLTLKPVERN